jgi:hypothetical protein
MKSNTGTTLLQAGQSVSNWTLTVKLQRKYGQEEQKSDSKAKFCYLSSFITFHLYRKRAWGLDRLSILHFIFRAFGQGSYWWLPLSGGCTFYVGNSKSVRFMFSFLRNCSCNGHKILQACRYTIFNRLTFFQADRSRDIFSECFFIGIDISTHISQKKKIQFPRLLIL